ncbi:hypothetical protein AB0I84_15730 [Streptomyces spectabilis]|uniref:hypothetical protein n=1 Tax=Streptomyces spectabilis TaxID=68270 RepID=UPI0033E5E75C
MTLLTDPTLGTLIELAVDSHSRANLEVLLMKSDLARFSQGGYSKSDLMVGALYQARTAAGDGDEQAQRALLSFAKHVAAHVAPRTSNDQDPRFERVREALLADGYDAQYEYGSPVSPSLSAMELAMLAECQGEPPRQITGVRLLPTDALPLPLGSEVSALEADLVGLGLDTAANHYRQAADNFTQHNFEASNGQLRSMLEAVVMHFAAQHGFTSNGRAGQGGPAIRHLVEQTSALPQRDGGSQLTGLWQMIHTNGPHPGQSNADEARVRMQLITATTRFLIAHFAATP